jgi:hypothetical protein
MVYHLFVMLVNLLRAINYYMLVQFIILRLH